jgi:protein SCO1/2
VKRWWLMVFLTFSALAHGADPATQVKLDPQFGAALPHETMWKDEYGRPISLDTVVKGHPTLLVLAYYHCPMLCPRVLQGLATTLRNSGLEKNKSLRIVVASIDPRDTTTVAAAAHQQFLDRALLPANAVHFLTGPSVSSKQLAAAVGISYAYDAEHGEYAHPATFILADNQGRVVRYLPAFTTTALDLRLTLADVAGGKPARIWDHALLLCYAYDPETGRYTLAITKILQIISIVTVFVLVGLFAWQHERGGR